MHFRLPTIAVGKSGKAPGQLNCPRTVSIESATGNIYVTDVDNNRIQIFSQTGDYLSHFGYPHLKWPWGILIKRDNIYVTDVGHDAIFLFRLPDLTMIEKAGKSGSGREEFDHPRQLAISPNQHLYIPDLYNDRVQIMTTDLKFIDRMRHESLHEPSDVKFSSNEIFVLSIYGNPCIHVFTLSGEKSRSVVTSGNGMQVEKAWSFCLDGNNNIVISDALSHDIKVFSSEGNLLHTIGRSGHEAGRFFRNAGIIVHDSMLLCISENKKFGLQIFSA